MNKRRVVVLDLRSLENIIRHDEIPWQHLSKLEDRSKLRQSAEVNTYLAPLQ